MHNPISEASLSLLVPQYASSYAGISKIAREGSEVEHDASQCETRKRKIPNLSHLPPSFTSFTIFFLKQSGDSNATRETAKSAETKESLEPCLRWFRHPDMKSFMEVQDFASEPLSHCCHGREKYLHDNIFGVVPM